MNKRQFLQTITFLGLSLNSFARNFEMTSDNGSNYASKEIINDEIFWTKIRSQFVLDENFTDFRANGASSMPRTTMNKFLNDFRYVQSFPSARGSAMTEDAMERLRKKTRQTDKLFRKGNRRYAKHD